MKIVDANVLLYAINQDSAQHQAARSWWENALNGDESIGLPWVVLLAFIRLATNRAVFKQPLTPRQAIDRVNAWLACPVVAVVTENDDHWAVLSTFLHRTGTAANLTTDAHLAALALSRDAALVSCDRDFGRFEGLRWISPLAS